MSFSLQKNKSWSGAGFFSKGSTLELSSFCFLEQQLILGSGKYKVKIIGSSISGNGTFSFSINSINSEVLSKKITFSGKNNTETAFDFEINSSGQHKIKLQRGSESIGRVSISLLNIVKVIEKKQEEAIIKFAKQGGSKEKTFLILDYDILDNFNFFNLLSSNISNNVFFLLKTNQNFILKEKSLNFKLFFEWEDLFDYISLYNSKSIFYLPENIDKSLFYKYDIKTTDISELKDNNTKFKNIPGILF